MTQYRRGILVRVILFLILGAIINVAVAWAFAVWEPEKTSGSVDVTEMVPGIFSKYGLSVQPGDELQGHQGSGIGLTFTSAVTELELTQILVLTEAGWPVRCLGGVLDLTMRLDGGSAAAFHYALELSPSIRPRNSFMPQLAFVLPLRPIWPGFAMNTIFYATMLWMLFAFPFALRRAIRRRHGRCERCGYDLRGHVATNESKPCPECGLTSSP